MPQTRKVFRIEQARPADEEMAAPEAEQLRAFAGASAQADAEAAQRHRETIAEIRAVRALIEGPGFEAKRALERIQAQFDEFQKLKVELDMIEGAITQTKQELATIHATGLGGPDIEAVADQLDAVVEGTEQATQAILGAVEEIGQCADALARAGGDDVQQRMTQDIQDAVVRVFEACNFQDLTGQRITKVVTTLKFIDERIARMMDIWGGLDAFAHYVPEHREERCGDDKLLNGPKLEGEDGHASQDDIDALFN